MIPALPSEDNRWINEQRIEVAGGMALYLSGRRRRLLLHSQIRITLEPLYDAAHMPKL